MKYKKFFLASILVLMTSSIASAHPGHGNNGLAGGFIHPFSGIDHLLAMIAVGLWAVQLGGAALYLLPISFVSVMVFGGLLAKLGLHIGDPDAFITTSLLVLGLLIAFAARLPLIAGTGLVGLFAIFHGYAHVQEGVLEQGHSMAEFAVGFVAATIILHCIGIAIGLSLKNRTGARLVRLAGAGIAACAVLIWMGWIQT